MLGDDVVFDNQTGAWKVEDVGEEQQLGGVPTRCHVPDDTECDRWFGAMWTAHTPQPTVPPKAVSWRQGAIPVSLRFSCLEPGSRFLATSLEDPSTGNLAAPAWRVPPCRQPQSPPPSPPEPPSLSRLQSAASRGRLVGGWTRARLRDSASIDTETEGRSVGWVAHPTQALRRSDDRVVSRALAFNIGSSVTTVARTMRWQARSVREPGAGSRMTRLARRQFAYTSLNEVLLKASLTHSWDRRDWPAVGKILFGWGGNLFAFYAMLLLFNLYGCELFEPREPADGKPPAGNTDELIIAWVLSAFQRFVLHEPTLILAGKALPILFTSSFCANCCGESIVNLLSVVFTGIMACIAEIKG